MVYTYSREVVGGSYDINNPRDVDAQGRPVLLAVRALEATGLPCDISCSHDTCFLDFGEGVDLDATQKAALDAAVAAHKAATGTPAPPVRFIASGTLSSGLVAGAIPETEIGGIATDPSFFVEDLSKVRGRLVGVYKTHGEAFSPTLTEAKDGEADVELLGAPVLPDTAGAWAHFALTTISPPRAGQNSYVAKASGGASGWEARYVSLTLLEVG